MINWQLSKQGIRWPVSHESIAGSGVDPSRSSFFWSYPLTGYLVFKWSQAQVCFLKNYMKYVVFMSLWPSTIKILISNLPRTRKFSQSFLTMVTRWSRSTSSFYTLIGQNMTGEFMRKIYAASWNLFTLTAEAERVLCFLMPFSTGCTKLNTAAIKSLLLLMAGLFIGFLVKKCVACQSRKSDFGWQFVFVFHLAWYARGV